MEPASSRPRGLAGSDSGEPESVCLAAERLKSLNSNLIDQLDKNRQQMLEVVPVATFGTCIP